MWTRCKDTPAFLSAFKFGLRNWARSCWARYMPHGECWWVCDALEREPLLEGLERVLTNGGGALALPSGL